MSQLIFGGSHIGNGLDEAASKSLIEAALETGINAFYTAPGYSEGRAQEIMGRAVRSRREQVVIINKLGLITQLDSPARLAGHPVDDFGLWQQGVAPTDHGLSAKSLTRALDESLRRLGTEYVDVCSVHFWDPFTPVEETLETLDGFVRAGKARYLGCSNWAGWHVHRARAISEKKGLAKLRAFQTEYNLLNRWPEREQLPACEAAGVGVLVFNSLASNFLTGELDTAKLIELAGPGRGRKRHLDEYVNDDTRQQVEELTKLAKECGRTPAELAKGWVLSRDVVTGLLVGPNEPTELEPMVNIVREPLTADELEAVETRVAVHAPPAGTARTPVLRLI